MPEPVASDAPVDIERDVAAIGRIEAVPTLLRVLCDTTGMGFAAVARVTDGTWTACAVQDNIAFGLLPGGQLDVHSTLCKEVREARRSVVIEHASQDAVYCNHHTPRQYAIEGYISVPIVLANGDFFGTLCAIDPRPTPLPPRVVATFELFAQLISLQLENERKHDHATRALVDERETGEMREQFIAVLGHDLRNPLAAIAACSQLLARRAADAEAVGVLATRIGNNVKRMSTLIDDVLDFARGRLGSGMALGSAVVTDLEQALVAVVAELRDVHPGRRIDSSIAIGRPVRGDRARLQQLASNLLANALEHGTHDAPVELDAGLSGDEFVIEVRNAGEPISQATQDRIFAPFWRHSQSTRPEGLGLGLHICEQIVRAHGGTLGVASSLEGGTRFTARMPIAGAPAPSA